MTRDADRYTFQVAWSEQDGEYVGSAVEFPTLSHRSATAEGALAGIQNLVADAPDGLDVDENSSQPYRVEKHYPVPCLVCGKVMGPALLGGTQRSGSVRLHIFGNYGSEIFDPLDDANWLEAVLCDGCLRSAIAAQRVLYAWRSHATTPAPIYQIATSENTIGIVDNPYLM